MQKFFDIIFSRALFLVIGFLLQIATIIFIVIKFQQYFIYFYVLGIVISVLLLLSLINSNMNPSYKIAWIIPIMLYPAFGWIFYIMFSSGRFSKVTKSKERTYYNKHIEKISKLISKDEKILRNIEKDDRQAMMQIRYLIEYGGSEVFRNYDSTYLEIGEIYFEKLIEELKKAEKFIFMEYFIIAQGKMWGEILEILKAKVKEGVEVRIIYDDFGCIMTLPKNYDKQLQKYGIKCSIFNKAYPIFSIIYNNRTHRKITVIDGKVAFTGGINLADEYINEIERFGHWKDTGIMVRGETAWGFTMMFLNNWEILERPHEDFTIYKCLNHTHNIENREQDGYVVPFSDSPLDQEIIGSNVYLTLINNATDYVYINTPYLIIDHEMTQALCLAGKKGVDVKIITPHIPDKKMVFEVTRSNYRRLIENGVKIYEYTPGFIHAKSFVVDDKYAVVGTINLDYRSLYLHFECGIFLYKTKTIKDIKKDYIKTLNLCEIYKLKDCVNISSIRKLYRAFLNVFSPLM